MLLSLFLASFLHSWRNFLLIFHEYMNVYTNDMQSNFGKVPVKTEASQYYKGSDSSKISSGKGNQERFHREAAFVLGFQRSQ